MSTARDIYEKSLVLLGEKEGENTASFEERALPLIRLILGELSEIDAAVKGVAWRYDVAAPAPESLSDEIGLGEAVVNTLAPFALAALLIEGEEPERSAFFHRLYAEKKETLRARGRRGRRHKIARPY